jgi:hypothetical protein
MGGIWLVIFCWILDVANTVDECACSVLNGFGQDVHLFL